MSAELKVNVGKDRHGGQQLGLEHESELYMGSDQSRSRLLRLLRGRRDRTYGEREVKGMRKSEMVNGCPFFMPEVPY